MCYVKRWISSFSFSPVSVVWLGKQKDPGECILVIVFQLYSPLTGVFDPFFVSTYEKSLNYNKFLYSALSVVQSGKGEGGFLNKSVFLFSKLGSGNRNAKAVCLFK